MPKVKDKERILKAARKKQRVTYKEVPIRLWADFSKQQQQQQQQKPLQTEGAGKKYSKWWKGKTYNLDYSLQQSYRLEWKGR